MHLLAGLLYEELKCLANVKVRWGHKFVGLVQDESQVTVQVETGQSNIRSLVADFVVGSDGARSSVRKALHKDSFPGFSWDFQIVATNVGPHLILPASKEVPCAENLRLSGTI